MEIEPGDSQQMIAFKLNHEQAMATHAGYNEDRRQVFSSAMDMALEAIRTAALINGGSVIAVFALLGTLFEGNDELSRTMRLAIIQPAFLFAGGAILCGIASGLSYFAQLAFARAHEEFELTFDHPFIKSTPIAKRFQRIGEGFRVVAVLAVIVSYAALITGLILGYSAFSRL